MKLIYSPYYGQPVYSGTDRIEFNTRFVGDEGLLDELELRLGLTGRNADFRARALDYCDALRCSLDNSNGTRPFYADSFDNDPVSTANELLGWRDNLVMAGWSDGYDTPEGISMGTGLILSALADAEKYFESGRGPGERWQAVLSEASSHPLEGVEIVLDILPELINPVIRRVLDEIETHSQGTVSVSADAEKAAPGNMLATVDGISIHPFDNQNDACQWGLSQDSSAVICSDAVSLNGTLLALGKQPAGGSSSSGLPQIPQLMKLGIALFRNPVDVGLLKEYLSIPFSPLADLESDGSLSSLNRTLVKHLLRAGGFGKNEITGKTWDDIVPEQALPWLGMWSGTDNGSVELKKVRKYCKALSEWADKKNSLGDAVLRSQLDELSALCRLMIRWVDGQDAASAPLDNILKVAVSLSGPASHPVSQAKAGSQEVVSDIRAVAAPARKAVWLDCYAEASSPYRYAFINPSDIDLLKGLMIESPVTNGRASLFALILGVSRCSELHVLVPKYADGEKKDTNIFIYLFNAAGGHVPDGKNGTDLPEELTVPVAGVQAESQQAEYRVTRIENKREKESYSSLSLLLHEPFDYVMDYLLRLKWTEPGNLETTKGTVAHAFIRKIAESVKGDNPGRAVSAQEFRGVFESDEGKALLDEAVIENGAVLLEPDNEIELSVFRHILMTRSVPSLLDILQANDMKIMFCEKPLLVNLPGKPGTGDAFTLDARIDMIAADGSGRMCIFDFKWTNSPDRREEEIKNDSDLQLELYQKAVEKEMGAGDVRLRGYYLLKQGRFITSDDTMDTCDGRVTVLERKESDVSLYDRFLNTYMLRMQSLYCNCDGNGEPVSVIEEGDGMKGAAMADTVLVSRMVDESRQIKANSGSYIGVEGVNVKYVKTRDDVTVSGTKADGSFGKNTILKGRIK